MNDTSKYESIKDDMKTGDGLGFANTSIISKLIIWKCHNCGPIPLSHWGGIIRLQEYEGLIRRRYTLEAESKGFILDSLSGYIKNYPGHIWWYPLKDELNCSRQEVGENALAMVGTGYDWLSIPKQLFMKVSTNSRKVFCSEAWQIIYGFKGKALNPTEMFKLGIFKDPIQLI